MRYEKYAIYNPNLMAESPKFLSEHFGRCGLGYMGKYHVSQNVFLVHKNGSNKFS